MIPIWLQWYSKFLNLHLLKDWGHYSYASFLLIYFIITLKTLSYLAWLILKSIHIVYKYNKNLFYNPHQIKNNLFGSPINILMSTAGNSLTNEILFN